MDGWGYKKYAGDVDVMWRGCLYSPTFLALVHQHVCVCSPPHHPARDGRGWKDFGDLEGSRSEVVLGGSWEASWGLSGGISGPSWETLGPLLGAVWAIFGAFWAVLRTSGAVLGASWAVLGASWAVLEPLGLSLGRQEAPRGLQDTPRRFRDGPGTPKIIKCS